MTRATIDCEQPLSVATYRGPQRPAVERFDIPAALPFEPAVTAEIVHDFRNTLAAVSMLSEIMVSELPELPQESPVREIVRDVLRGCTDALELCDRLLPKSGCAPQTGEQVDLSDLVTRIAPLLRTYVRPPSTLQLDLADDLPLLECVPGALPRILMNLVKNAGEALDEDGGQVTVRTGWIDPDAAQLGDMDEDTRPSRGPRLCLTVCDTGCGMDDLTQARLLRSSFTTKHNGHGLGMASVLRMAAQQGASVLVESQTGQGTTVHVVFDDAPPPRRRA